MLEFEIMKSLKGISLLVLALFLIFGIGLVLLWAWNSDRNTRWLDRFTRSAGVESSTPTEAPDYAGTPTLPQSPPAAFTPTALASPGVRPENYTLWFALVVSSRAVTPAESDFALSLGVTPIPPDKPALVAPLMGETDAAATLPLQVAVNDVNGQDLNVTFYGRPVTVVAENPFTFVILPDTQVYSLSDAVAELFKAQMNWIVGHQNSLSIQFVSHLGDITEHGNVEGEWLRIDPAFLILEQGGVRYGVIPGNHDRTEDYGDYMRYFPPDRYQADDWYGGYLGDPTDGIPDFGEDRQNLDNYQLFSVGTIDFIFINLEIDSPQVVIEWANALLQAFPERHAVITTHAFIDAGGERPSVPYINEPGQNSAETVWQQLVYPNCNVLMVLNGHYPGEARRTDMNVCGEPVYQMAQDYQTRSNGGDGWLRYLVFEPAEGQIEVFTYSPSLDEFENDADSRFTLDFPMEALAPFDVIGSVTVTSGSLAQVVWSDLVPGANYEWYVVVSDGSFQTKSATWNFITQP